MLMRAQIGQLFVFGFDGTEVTPHLRRLITEYHIGGLILFRHNAHDVEQVWRLLAALAEIRPDIPTAIFIDEEGGPVSRLPSPVLRLPPMRVLGHGGSAALCFEIGTVLGRELSALGVHVNLAPVVDVDTFKANPVIGPRALHEAPARVASLGAALMRGLHRGGVTGCPKHFPGHGDTTVDSHHALPTITHDMERLESCELIPFRRVIAAGARMLMTAHLLLEAYDPIHPVTLSPYLLPKMIRQQLGFEGLVISDDLGMAATAERYTPGETMALGIAGAVDLFLLRGDEQRQLEFVEAAIRLAEHDPGARARMAERAGRVLAWKRRHLRREQRASAPKDLTALFASERRAALVRRIEALSESGNSV